MPAKGPVRAQPDESKFNSGREYPYQLRWRDFEMAVQDVYDFFFDVNKHSRTLVQNRYFKGHPDLVVQGVYPKNSIQSGTDGVEIKTTRKPGGAVDTHGARKQWMCVFVYETDATTEPANARSPLVFTEIYLGEVVVGDFRKNARGELGTRTATLDAKGIARLRENWVYRLR